MWISQLDLTQWRNHEATRTELGHGISVLIGPNGQGKTNVVEALRYLATLSSHRVASHGPLIGDNHDTATIFAHLHHGERQVSAGLTLKRRGASEAILNGQKTKVSEIPRWVSTVMFAPEDSAIIRGEPGFRRAFLDELVVGSTPAMVATFSEFERVLKQRNSLLKSLKKSARSADLSTLATWTERLAHSAAEIIHERIQSLQDISPYVTGEYENLAGGDPITLTYQPKGYELKEASRESILNALTQALNEVQTEELERGMTLVGPHRDDAELLIASRPARTHASQGETWSLALALRLGMASWIRSTRASGDPIMILDDVFAELDRRRRDKLVTSISSYEQLLITTAVEEDLPSNLQGERFDVREGVVSRR